MKCPKCDCWHRGMNPRVMICDTCEAKPDPVKCPECGGPSIRAGAAVDGKPVKHREYYCEACSVFHGATGYTHQEEII